MSFETNRANAELRASSITMRSTLDHLLPWYPGKPIGSDDPNYVRVRWRRAHFAKDADQNWLYPGPDADPRAIAPLSVDKELFHKIQAEHHGVAAVAYRLSRAAVRLGHEVMIAGFVQKPKNAELFDDDPSDSSRYAVGMAGLGTEYELAAGIGVYDPHRRRFWPVHDELSKGDTVSREANVLPVVRRLDL